MSTNEYIIAEKPVMTPIRPAFKKYDVFAPELRDTEARNLGWRVTVKYTSGHVLSDCFYTNVEYPMYANAYAAALAHYNALCEKMINQREGSK